LQTSGVKGEVVAEQAAKRPKVEVVADIAKPATPRSSSDPGSVASPHAEMMGDKNKSVDNVLSHSPKTSTTAVLQESMSLKEPIRQLASGGPPFPMNRYKLDNRPTAFRITPPLPPGLATVSLCVCVIYIYIYIYNLFIYIYKGSLIYNGLGMWYKLF
jgi:RNA-binding protein 26